MDNFLKIYNGFYREGLGYTFEIKCKHCGHRFEVIIGPPKEGGKSGPRPVE